MQNSIIHDLHVARLPSSRAIWCTVGVCFCQLGIPSAGTIRSNFGRLLLAWSGILLLINKPRLIRRLSLNIRQSARCYRRITRSGTQARIHSVRSRPHHHNKRLLLHTLGWHGASGRKRWQDASVEGQQIVVQLSVYDSRLTIRCPVVVRQPQAATLTT